MDQTHDSTNPTDVAPTFEETAQALEHWLATKAEAGVSELVLVGLLRGYADEIQRHGYIPRSWNKDTTHEIPVDEQ